MLAEKDHTIEVLHKKLKGQQKLTLAVKSKPQLQTSFYCLTVRATAGIHDNVTGSRDFILENLHSIPRFGENNFTFISDEVVGFGQFGVINRGNIKSLKVTVAAKVSNFPEKKKAIFSEVVVLLTLSGNSYFPYCYGLYKDSVILMEFLGDTSSANGGWPTLNQLQKQNMLKHVRLTYIMVDLLNAVLYMHNKNILHNDIKADVMVGDKRTVLIDFGKATMIKSPLTYNIALNDDYRNLYNSKYRHLAHELRNVPATKQSPSTDGYSVGYMMKHVGAVIPYDPIIEIDRMLKRQDVNNRNLIKKLL